MFDDRAVELDSELRMKTPIYICTVIYLTQLLVIQKTNYLDLAHVCLIVFVTFFFTHKCGTSLSMRFSHLTISVFFLEQNCIENFDFDYYHVLCTVIFNYNSVRNLPHTI